MTTTVAADDDLLIGPSGGADPLSDTFDLGDDLLGNDPLSNLGPQAADPSEESPQDSPPDPHEALWTENCYPSAETCEACHPTQYEEWRGSGHAYAAVSPMFNGLNKR